MCFSAALDIYSALLRYTNELRFLAEFSFGSWKANAEFTS